MQVKKINENQVRCVINREDIMSRNTNLIELFHNREKMHSLFSDMMAEVSKEYGDSYQDSGIMMEAIITMEGSIVVTLTKQDTKETKDTLTDNTTTEKNKSHLVYSFDDLSMVMRVSALLKDFDGENTLYKDSMTDKYYLVFSKDNDDTLLNKTIYFLNEYGVEESCTEIFFSYMMEHFEVLTKNSAVQTLATIK